MPVSHLKIEFNINIGSPQRRFSELAWLPIHRFVLITIPNMISARSKILNQIPLLCFKSLSDLLKNPNFNRFEYNSKALLQDIEFPKSLANLTLYFVANLDTRTRENRIDSIEEDTEATRDQILCRSLEKTE